MSATHLLKFTKLYGPFPDLITMLTVAHKHYEDKKKIVYIQKSFTIMWDLFFKHRQKFSPSFFSSFLNYNFS